MTSLYIAWILCYSTLWNNSNAFHGMIRCDMLQKIALQPEADARLVTSLLIKTILVVKNDATRNWPFSQHLPLKSPHYALLASSGDAALRLVKQIKPDLL